MAGGTLLIILIILKCVLQTMVVLTQNAVLALWSLPCEATMRGQQSATRETVFTRTQPCQHSDLGLSASKSIRNQFPLFISHPSPQKTVVTGKNKVFIFRDLE